MTDIKEKIGKVTMDRVTQLLDELKSGEQSLLTLEQTHAEIGRAALQALMEPADEMIEAMCKAWLPNANLQPQQVIYDRLKDAWQAAIKEVMKGTDK